MRSAIQAEIPGLTPWETGLAEGRPDALDAWRRENRRGERAVLAEAGGPWA